MIYYGGVYHPLVHVLSEEQAFISPASGHSIKQAKRIEGCGTFLMNAKRKCTARFLTGCPQGLD